MQHFNNGPAVWLVDTPSAKMKTFHLFRTYLVALWEGFTVFINLRMRFIRKLSDDGKHITSAKPPLPNNCTETFQASV
jgi:hypothetical protein